MTFVNVVRGITRPLLTLIWLLATVVYLWFALALPEAWWALGLGMIGWWFYDRTKQKGDASPADQPATSGVSVSPAVYVVGVLFQPAVPGSGPTPAQPTGPPDVKPTYS